MAKTKTARDKLELRPGRWLRVFMAEQGLSQLGLGRKAWPREPDARVRTRVKNAVHGRLRWLDEHWRPIIRALGKRAPEFWEPITESKVQKIEAEAKEAARSARE